jgi:hypothetical protein
MPNFDNTNRGVFFRNDRKKPESREPDYRGRLNVDGAEYELAGWVREGKNGKYLSLSIKRVTIDRGPTVGAVNEESPF